MTRSVALVAFLASAGVGVHAFAPRQQSGAVCRTTHTALNAKPNDTFASVARRVAGTGAAFLAGVGFASQIAFADPSALVAGPLGEL